MKNKHDWENQIRRIFDYCIIKKYEGYLVACQRCSQKTCNYCVIKRDELNDLENRLKADNINNHLGVGIISVFDLSKPYNKSKINFNIGK